MAEQGPSSSMAVESSQMPLPPCSISSFMSAIPSGVLGWVFGVLPSIFRNPGFKHRKQWFDDGGRSGWQFFALSGAYSFTHCLLVRLRQTDDAFSRGAAGCATGLVIGWSGGPMMAAQSCAGIGLISYFVDFGSMDQPAVASTMTERAGKAAAEQRRGARCCSVALGTPLPSARQVARPRTVVQRQAPAGGEDALALHRLPPVMWLGAVCSAGQSYLSSAPSLPLAAHQS